MKPPHSPEDWPIPNTPDLEKITNRVCDLAETIDQKEVQQLLNHWVKQFSRLVIKKLIYDEAKFREFIKFCSAQGWISEAEANTCLKDLEQETPQELLALLGKTEALAIPGWGIPLIYEILNGSNNLYAVYLFGMITRGSASYYLSEGIVKQRKMLACGESIPHIGRFSLLIVLAEEHPELARMFWVYSSRKCRQLQAKTQQDNYDPQKAKERFEARHQSNTVSFLLSPKQKAQEWLKKNN